jgi:hypothetical protein
MQRYIRVFVLEVLNERGDVMFGVAILVHAKDV